MIDGIEQIPVRTHRLSVSTLQLAGRDDGEPVIFVHGNVSSSAFWQPALLGVPPRFRPIAIDLRGFGGSDTLPVDATRGLRDFAEDVAGVLDTLKLTSAHLVGWSMGGGVVLQLLRDQPERVTSVCLVNPVSPYGFGGTHGPDGVLNDPAGAGTGGGTANPDFVARLASGDQSSDGAASPRNVMLNAYVKPPFVPDLADEYVASMLSTTTGDDNYPGDAAESAVWPGVAPGNRGVVNAMAPTNFRIDDLAAITPKPPIRWIRGSDDQIVSDTSIFDLAYLGSIGTVPGWPGDDVAPPQPMVEQTRAALAKYAAAGGTATEVVIDDTGHSPHVEKPAEFLEALVAGLDVSSR